MHHIGLALDGDVLGQVVELRRGEFAQYAVCMAGAADNEKGDRDSAILQYKFVMEERFEVCTAPL